ncbi:hypothetical protein PZ938_00010, partial [Luteipulveratus sp. YIM 133132]|uniref:hypothetical protein n=1 Tax=Luteipulveratus flavus TaxID=3031728 RepID=UPI0023B11BA0
LDDAVAVILRDRADRGWTERGNPGVAVEALSAAAAGRQVEVARDEATGQPRLTGTTSTSDLRVELDDPDTVADWLRTTREVADPLVESALRRADDDPRGEASLIIDQATSTEDLQGRRHSAIVLVDPDAQDAAAMAYDSAADAARVATVTAEGGDDVYAGAGLEDARDAMVAARPRTVRAAPGTTRAPASAARLPQPAHGLAQQARQRNDTRQLDVSQNARHVLQEAAAREATYAHHRYDKPKTATPQSGQETR